VLIILPRIQYKCMLRLAICIYASVESNYKLFNGVALHVAQTCLSGP